eukprot:TRINITY_DN9066_c0_g1_i1.p1 TRINITY_DN9066_c0_g1~~TRINITY_DN9066_c0_g1_i1.p1  ORF type:complete len:890 (+),score=199.35 TRINITY_DN9066_c0_g1_i1:33-2672(+)
MAAADIHISKAASLQGWLRILFETNKFGGSAYSKRKYFALFGDTLAYYDSDTAFESAPGRPEDEIYQPAVTFDRPSAVEDKDNTDFSLTSSYGQQDKKWRLRAETPEDFNEWDKAIRYVMSSPEDHHWSKLVNSTKEGYVAVIRGKKLSKCFYFAIRNAQLFQFKFKLNGAASISPGFALTGAEIDFIPKSVFGMDFVLRLDSASSSIVLAFASEQERMDWVEELRKAGGALRTPYADAEEKMKKDNSAYGLTLTFSDISKNVREIPVELEPLFQATPGSDKRLVLKGKVKICFGGDKKVRDRLAFLTSDALLLTKEGDMRGTYLKFKEVFPIATCVVYMNLPPKSGEPSSFSKQNTILMESMEKGSLFLSLKNIEEKLKWSRSLGHTICESMLKVNEAATMDYGWQHAFVKGTIHSCAMKGNVDHLQHLLEEKSWTSLDVVDDFFSATALHLACHYGNPDIVAKLLVFGASLRPRDIDSNEPIHCAARMSHGSCLDHIISKVSFKSKSDAENLCNSLNGSQKCVLWLSIFGDDDYKMEKMVFMNRTLDVVERVVIGGADPNGSDVETGLAAIHQASILNMPEVINVLVSLGAEVNLLTPTGDSCLHLAAKFAAESSMKALLRNGALPNVQNGYGQTPIQSVPDEPAIAVSLLELLLSNGARTADGSFRPELEQHWESFRQARASYIKSAMTYGEGRKKHFRWVDDEESPECLCCSAPFSVVNRRHHCRYCGILCCRLCSSKQFKLFGKEKQRCCDGCFNLLRAKYGDREDVKGNNQSDAKTLEDDYLKRSKHEDRRNSEEDIGASRTGTLKSKPRRSLSVSGGSAQQQMAMNKDKLVQRGEKLSKLEDKSAMMKDDANDFLKLAKQLREQEEKRSKWI